MVNTASDPLGPWTTRTVTLDPGCAVTKWPNCVAGDSCSFGGNKTVAPDGHCGSGGPGPPFFPQVCRPITNAQQNAVITYRRQGTATPDFIWTGDRWQSGWNGTGAPRPGFKGWDYQTWLPLTFDDTGTPPIPRPLEWVDSFELAGSA